MNQKNAVVLTIGNFDGLHRGHQQLIGRTTTLAQQEGLEAVALTFNPHPQSILEQSPMPLITSLEQRQRELYHLGIDRVEQLVFNIELAQLNAQQFLTEKVIAPFNPHHICIGYDFVFGKNRHGNINLLQKLSSSLGYTAHCIDALVEDGQPISSSRIRGLLKQSQFSQAQKLLGKPYSIEGTIITGQQRGLSIGFPTANIDPQCRLSLTLGVYAGWGTCGNMTAPLVFNYGIKPTASPIAEPIVEAHFINKNLGNLYGEMLSITPLFFIRPEKRFNSIAELSAQIQQDCQQASRLLAEL